jgi:hypothetical protein
MKKLIAILVTAFAVAACVITGPPPNTHAVSSAGGIQPIVPDSVDLAQNVFANDNVTLLVIDKPLGCAIDVVSVRSTGSNLRTSLVESSFYGCATVNHQPHVAWWKPAPDWPDVKVA